MKLLTFDKVSLGKGYLRDKKELNKAVTINAVYDRFSDTGRFRAFSCDWKEGDEQKPHYFWDSDVAKWIESASYILSENDDKTLRAKIEKVIDDIERNQDENGYFNIYFTAVKPNDRFTNRAFHELYCAGHLIEAAIAYHNATGEDRFLGMMEKYAEYIYRVFVVEDSAAFVTPGHEEIELALIKLFCHTGKKRYLELAGFFLEKRGANSKDTGNDCLTQSHLPIREQKTAEGHAVRAGYLYSAMADYAYHTNDEELKEACKSIFDDILYKKMYITGGIGSSSLGETFTVAYDLPNTRAYAETCAAIALMFFANRMLQLENNAKYADVVERAMYNGMLSGVSLDGKSFFYENPLEINLKKFARKVTTSQKEHFPITQRVEVFGCSCCPPNINRVLPSIGSYIYGMDEDTLYINQFVDSKLEYDKISAEIKTTYPNDGNIAITAHGVKRIAVRIPSWVGEYSISKQYTLENGYAVIENDNAPVSVSFDMTPRIVQANPLVWDDSGKVAITRGPIVYCAERVDNQKELHTLYIDSKGKLEAKQDDTIGLPTIIADGFSKHVSTELYSDYTTDDLEKEKIKLIPYSAFANRGESDMLVYLNVR